MCNTCEVPLCACPFGRQNNNDTCFQLWHEAVKLLEEHQKTHDSIIRAKLNKRLADEIGDNNESSTNSEDNLSQHEMFPGMPPLPQVHMPTEVSQTIDVGGISFSPIINCNAVGNDEQAGRSRIEGV
jgi:hypothetical protein